MTLRIIDEKQAPIRLVKSSVVTRSSDWSEVMEALRKMSPGQALIVYLSDPDLIRLENSEKRFATSLQTYFDYHKLQVLAYASGEKQVTVRRQLPTDVRKKRRPKG